MMAAVTTQTPRRESTPPRPGPEPVNPERRHLPFPFGIYQTAVGKKWVMALTGVGLLGFIAFHTIGNLHVYEGPVQIAEYGEALRDLGGHLVPRTLVLWLARLGLIAMFAFHIHSAYSLQRMGGRANDDAQNLTEEKRYPGGQDFVAASFASRTMRWTGPIIGLFIVYHLADLTWGLWSWTDFERGDPYHNLATSLANWPVALIYIVANVALAIHIFHGTWSLFQSLGISSPRINAARRIFAGAFAGLILVGNLSFPILVQAGLVNEDGCDEPCALTELEAGSDDDEGHEAVDLGGDQ
jgi:succinate dehydrogenase / fumarate reductase cytochrome b subunit